MSDRTLIDAEKRRQPSPVRPRQGADPVRSDLGRLTVQCADRPGIVAAVSQFLTDHGANIVESDQATTDPVDGQFFLRMTFHRPGLQAHLDDMTKNFTKALVEKFEVTEWSLRDASTPKRVAIMVSKYDHCLLDLLWRARRGELPVDIGLVISNHADLASEVRTFGVPFVHIPVARDTKPEAEARQLQLLQGNFDLVVLARYMQILSADFLDSVGCPVINIHHSFLPAFAGAGPYERAKERGVKLIGATAHYATEDLDEGPIIEQDVVRVRHSDNIAALKRRGADVERLVLSRAVLWHCEDRVLRHGNSTVVFS
ncbi:MULTISPECIES: formyltetrahydrofolate deformylase [Protofrankia]|uniref:Formyltetrahydrofolate deformylase n=1 Tax=Candidatus Protofrankia datiscae TaxID=2716812 RepID=F8B1H3_9ACTN|nr:MULTISPECIES: formyltetrahydrofolate deformylase [Protofrankia]AEH10725.1 formyltetrahydrofolate deformylase [Candidatus Protofrankia datiscae]